MKQTLINKYLAGETTISEERELRGLLLDTPDAQRSKAERSILELLSYSESEEVEEDIFVVDYTDEYDKHVRPLRTIRLWPWLAAACVAALLVVFLAPPREDANQVAKVEKTIVSQKELKDSVKTEPISQPMQEEKQLAQVAKRKTSTAKPGDRVLTQKQEESIAEQTPANNEVAINDGLVIDEDMIMAEQLTQFKEMEMAFLSHSAPIKERGQQVMHRVAMLQQEQRNQKQFVEL